MAASKTYFARANTYRFLPTDQPRSNDSMMFELDESEIWNSTARSQSPEFRKISSKIGRKAPAIAAARGGAASLPMNVPDWSKILKDAYIDNRWRESDEEEEEEIEDGGDRVPPHEFLAMQMAKTRIASFSVHEGIGRTLKGRDLSRVRNAIWQKTGFED